MKLIVKMKFGAHLYGTATPESDIDYKGVFLPSREEILLGRIPKSQAYSTGRPHAKNRAGDVDSDDYSLHYFIHLACQGQTVAMDMLHAPAPMLLHTTDVWQAIVSRRHRFYTKNLNALITYARRQAGKYGIKGSRLDAVRQVCKLLQEQDPLTKMSRVWSLLPRSEHCREMPPTSSGIRQYRVCGKTIQETATIGYVLPILTKFYDTYGQRAKLAAQNKSIDWKAVSHALRATYQVEEILTHGTITYPLKSAPFLKAVKQGRLDYLTQVAPALEDLMARVETIAAQSRLPHQVDRRYWDDFICSTLTREYFPSDAP